MRLLLPLLLTGCGWNHTPDGGSWNTAPLWSPDGIIATSGSLYVPLKRGQIAYIEGDGSFASVDLDGGQARGLMALPDQTGIAALIDRQQCVSDGRDDCAETRTLTQLGVIEDGVLQARADIAQHLNTVAFAPGGDRAIGWLDGTATAGTGGIVNLGEIDIVDLDSGVRTPVRVGFAADTVLFTDDGARAVVLSRSEVAVVDLNSSPPRASVTFPLTLDPDQVVTPVGVDLTPDGTYALISTESSGDLYVLDLLDPSVNLISLPGTPSSMHVEASTNETLFTFSNRAELAILDHERFDLRTLPLDEPASEIATSEQFAVLYSGNGRSDVYRYAFETGELTEYRLLAPPTQLTIAPDESFAVAFTERTAAADAGMELIDLRGERGDTIPYGLQQPGVGLAYTQSDDGSVWALVLQSSIDTLWRGELSTGLADVIELARAPVGLGDLGDGRFYIAHDDGLGLISLYDPSTDALTQVSGFALDSVLDGPAEPLEAN